MNLIFKNPKIASHSVCDQIFLDWLFLWRKKAPIKPNWKLYKNCVSQSVWEFFWIDFSYEEIGLRYEFDLQKSKNCVSQSVWSNLSGLTFSMKKKGSDKTELKTLQKLRLTVCVKIFWIDFSYEEIRLRYEFDLQKSKNCVSQSVWELSGLIFPMNK